MRNIKSELLGKAVDNQTAKLTDIFEEIDMFLKKDDKKNILMLELISQADLEEAELIESLMSKTIDKIKKTILDNNSRVYTEQELSEANSIMIFIKFHIAEQMNTIDEVDNDLNPPHVDGMGVVNI